MRAKLETESSRVPSNRQCIFHKSGKPNRERGRADP